MSDILSEFNNGKNINICNLSPEEKKIILELRTLSSQDKTKVISSIDKIFENLAPILMQIHSNITNHIPRMVNFSWARRSELTLIL